MARKAKCFTFTWKFENAAYCVQIKDKPIYSPSFVVDSIDKKKWRLGLFPRGQDNEYYKGFFLYRAIEGKGNALVKIEYELEFIGNDGSVLTPCETIKCDFSENQAYGPTHFQKPEEVFATKRSIFLTQDTLTARCRIWKRVGKMTKNVMCFARTRIGVKKRSFVWNVNNFSSLKLEKKCTFQIKSFEDNTPLMSINLFLAEGLSYDEVIRFELSLQDQTIKFSTLRLFLIDASGNKIESNQEEFLFSDPSKCKEFTCFFTKNKLMERKSSYLPDDILSLYWEWAFSKGVVSEEIEDVRYTCDDSSTDQNVNNKNMVFLSYTLNDNLKSFCNENFLCDVKLKTATRIFNAHKIILSASSSVFKFMFSIDMKENNSNCVDIEDLSADTIDRMLHFIYTTRVEDLTWERASHLYVAADKYAILNMKHICSSYIKENLSPSNACEVLLLSDIHADNDLKSCIQDYILKNINAILKSDGWKILMETNAKLAAETLCLQYE